MTYCRVSGKQSHSTREEAQRHLKALRHKMCKYDGEVYPCLSCRGFHVGRPRKGTHQNKYRQR